MINLDQILSKAIQPFTNIQLKGEEIPLFFPEDLTQEKYMLHQQAQIGLAKAYEQFAPEALNQPDDIATANKIKKVLGLNKGKIKNASVYERVGEGQYWPWTESGPQKIQYRDENGKDKTEAALRAESESAELFLSASQIKELDATEGNVRLCRILVDGEEWGILESAKAVSVEAITSVALELGNKLPPKAPESISLSTMPAIENARFPFKKMWLDSLVEGDFKFDFPPAVINILFLEVDAAMKTARAEARATDEPEAEGTEGEAPNESPSLELAS